MPFLSGTSLNDSAGFAPMGSGGTIGGGGGGGGYGSQFDWGKTQLGYTQAQAAQKALGAQQAAAGVQEAQTSAAPGLLTAQNRQSRFNQMFPLVQGAYSALSSQLGGQQGAPGSGGGAPPKIDTSPIWTPSQVQGQVNSGVAANDAQTASNIRSNAQGLAGRGFGGRSPLLSELTAQAQGQGLQANNQVRQAVPFNAAQGNAQQLLAGQQAQQGQYQSGQEDIIQRQQIAAQQQSALLSALSNLAA
jgi:hypothetical protein